MSKVKDARLAAGMSQQAVADLIGMPKRTLESWEEGKRTPPEWVETLVAEKIERSK